MILPPWTERMRACGLPALDRYSSPRLHLGNATAFKGESRDGGYSSLARRIHRFGSHGVHSMGDEVLGLGAFAALMAQAGR